MKTDNNIEIKCDCGELNKIDPPAFSTEPSRSWEFTCKKCDTTITVPPNKC